MRGLKGAGFAVSVFVGLVLSLFLFAPVSEAVETPEPAVCDTETKEARSGRDAKATAKQDDRNLCLALHPIKNPEDRYKHKDHSTYYCSLIRSRDKMIYCNAVVQGDSSNCENVVDAKLAKLCMEKSK